MNDETNETESRAMTKIDAITALCRLAPLADERECRALLVASKALSRAVAHKNRNKAARAARGKAEGGAA